LKAIPETNHYLVIREGYDAQGNNGGLKGVQTHT